MKIVLQHALPRKIDYLKLFASIGSASFYLSVNGRNVQWLGRIEAARSQRRSFTDQEYVRYRMYHPVDEILAENSEEVVVRTKEGVEEQWLKPKWLLRRRRVVNKMTNSQGAVNT
ncbi:MAG: hypothetical protein HY619_01365 [Thaumarchaeota archaeon]|nr:hypothetical protein [Nitrososphaerota archaeon]